MLPPRISVPPEIRHSPERLGYTLQESAMLLGISYPSAWRLWKRGLLKSSKALRKKIIPRAELERFLRETL